MTSFEMHLQRIVARYKEADSTLVRLYRGMLESEFRKLRVFEPTKHSGNVATKSLSTAKYYASQRADPEEPGLVIQFDAPSDAVKQDPWFKEDYRFTRNFRPSRVRVIMKGIIGPIRESSDS